MALISAWGGPFGFLLELVGGVIYWFAVGWFRRPLKAELTSEDNKIWHALIGGVVLLAALTWLIIRTTSEK